MSAVEGKLAAIAIVGHTGIPELATALVELQPFGQIRYCLRTLVCAITACESPVPRARARLTLTCLWLRVGIAGKIICVVQYMICSV